MSNTESKPAASVLPSEAVGPPVSLREMAILLVKHYGLTEGTYTLLFQYQVGTGAVGPDKENRVPGVMVGVTQVGLVRTTKSGPNTVDAGEVNPPTEPSKRKARATTKPK